VDGVEDVDEGCAARLRRDDDSFLVVPAMSPVVMRTPPLKPMP